MLEKIYKVNLQIDEKAKKSAKILGLYRPKSKLIQSYRYQIYKWYLKGIKKIKDIEPIESTIFDILKNLKNITKQN